jgi:protease-4
LRKIDPAALRADIDNLPQTIASTQGDLAQLALERTSDRRLATRADSSR